MVTVRIEDIITHAINEVHYATRIAAANYLKEYGFKYVGKGKWEFAHPLYNREIATIIE